MKKLKQWIKRNEDSLSLCFTFLVGFFIGGLIVGESSSSKNTQIIDKIRSDNFDIVQIFEEKIQTLEASMSGCLSTIVELENKPPEIIYKTIYETVEKPVDINPTNTEYETWCRNNISGLAKDKGKDGKLFCIPLFTMGCVPGNYNDPNSLIY